MDLISNVFSCCYFPCSFLLPDTTCDNRSSDFTRDDETRLSAPLIFMCVCVDCDRDKRLLPHTHIMTDVIFLIRRPRSSLPSKLVSNKRRERKKWNEKNLIELYSSRREIVIIVDISSRCEQHKPHKRTEWTDGRGFAAGAAAHVYTCIYIASLILYAILLKIKWFGIYSLADNKWPEPAASSSS